MHYLDRSIIDIHNALLKGEVTPLELVQEALKRAKEDDNNAFEYIAFDEAIKMVEALKDKDKNELLWGIPFVIKDNYSTKDIPTTASSNVLNGYTPIFSSEVYQRLIDKGAILIGKATLDELAMGGTGMTGHLGYTFNPWDKSHLHQIGGSSCGSAASVSSGIVPLAIGSDTGDSVRKPAGYAALVGFKPSWGRISRFGLFPFAPSLDHVAYFTRNVKDSALTLSVLAGRDEKDSTSSTREVEPYLENINSDIKGKKIAVIEEILDSVENQGILDAYHKTLKALEAKGAIINRVHMPLALCKAVYPTYKVISCCEATSNNANLDGIKFGPRYEGDNYEEVMTKARTKGFSELIKRRFIIGGYSLLKENQEELFLRAQKCRRLIVDAVNNILADNDVIYLPASPNTAPLFNAGSNDKLSNEYLIADNYLAIGNFGGLPSLTLPLGFEDGLPFGGNVTGRAFDEQTVFNISLAIEEITGLKDLVAKEGK
ncbi:MAG: amidase family protein [Bacilli bacterium]|nr:amidase family protein [Bacilli bacterium]